MDKVKLTQYSHGAGCGCKISPEILTGILHTEVPQPKHPNLLVGNDTRDDAAVFDIGGGRAIISTTDFFMPIVDDARDFGRIASANAISDIYAMGGRPMMAIAILGWPIDKIPAHIAAQVMEGAREVCAEAGIPLAGGHSIDNQEPLFGLAVTGEVAVAHLKRNSTGKPGCLLYLTKPLGVGILSTAQKKGMLSEKDADLAKNQMIRLNKVGEALGKLDFVASMTDVTGFGLLGHLTEICDGSDISAEVDFEQVPIIPEALPYLERNCIPGGTVRNWDSYGDRIATISERQRHLLCDPQTSGGLLVLVEEDRKKDFESLMKKEGFNLTQFGRTVPKKEKAVYIR